MNSRLLVRLRNHPRGFFHLRRNIGAALPLGRNGVDPADFHLKISKSLSMRSVCGAFGWLACVVLLFAVVTSTANAQRHATIAAAADLHYAMDALIVNYRSTHPQDMIDVTYGSSGTLLIQIEQGAPFDLFFSADSDYPLQLVARGDALSAPVPYAMGHIVLWSASVDARKLEVKDLAATTFDRIAIANPQHAPYGKRAEQALRAAGVWSVVQSRLVYGDNIAQASQFAMSGNVKVGIVAQSLALEPKMAAHGTYALIPASLYQPLVQSFVLTRHGASNPLAKDFAQYVQGGTARAVLRRYGFELPSPRTH